MNQNLLNFKVDFASKIKAIAPVNHNFTLCRCYVMATGKNYNKSNISKEAVNDALPTLYNIPVVGHVLIDEDGNMHMGGHDIELKKDTDGKYKFKSLTVPFGTVPEDDNIFYEEVREPNGETKTYLVADIILWTGRYPELLKTIYDEKVYWGQSMEIEAIEIAKNREDKEYIDIKKFVFSGLCLLGKSDDEDFNHTPCFPSARVEPYKFTLDENFSQQLKQMKDELTLCFNNQKIEKEVVKLENNIQSNIENSEVDKTTEDKEKTFEPDTANSDADKEAVVEPVVEVPAQEGSIENHEALEDKVDENLKENFILTVNEKRESLRNALSQLESSDASFYLIDFDDEFTYVEKNDYHNSKARTTKGRLRYGIIENIVAFDLNSFEEVIMKYLTIEEASELEKMLEEKDVLQNRVSEYEAREKELKYSAVLNEFNDIKEDIEFKEIQKNILSYESEDALREKLFILFAKRMRSNEIQFATNKSNKEIKVPVKMMPGAESDPYGGLIQKIK